MERPDAPGVTLTIGDGGNTPQRQPKAEQKVFLAYALSVQIIP